MNQKYSLEYKLNTILLNKYIGIFLAIVIPIASMGSSIYSSQRGNIALKIPSITLPKVEKLDNFSNVFSNIFKIDSKTAPISDEVVSNIEPIKDSVFKTMLEPLHTTPVNIVVLTSEGKEVTKTDVIKVGVNDDGSLQAPATWNDAGWFNKGSMPGEKGNMIINAHYDDNYGRPAAFWQLKTLKAGDKVIVEDAYGKKYTYAVTDKYFVGINDPDRAKVFDAPSDGGSIVTLITCGGVWLPGQANYDKRLVVKAELVGRI